jgi:hypothetical protein
MACSPFRSHVGRVLRLLLGAGLWSLLMRGAEPTAAERSKIPCDSGAARVLTARRASGPVVVDGRLDDTAWAGAEESARFVDLIAGTPTFRDTRVKLLWDDVNLYVGYRIEEPRVRAMLTRRNDPIYTENDVEFFIAGDDAYYEFEINARNTVYEVFFIWEASYEKAGFARLPEFARTNLKDFNGVGFVHHPRGRRLGHFDWAFPGLRTAVHVEGTLNDDTDTDRGWTVELALPWDGIRRLFPSGGRSIPAKEGDEWRMDFSRFNTAKEPAPAKDSGGWALNPHGIWDSHIPECFARVRFTTNTVAIPGR